MIVDPARPLNDRYQIVRKLASGGMGDVFLARQTGPVAFNRLVVLKSLHRDLTADPDFVAMFLNEAQLVANLTHPNIVHIYELFQESSGYVIAMEYVRGASVLDLLRACRRSAQRSLPFGPAIRIATSVCDALHYAYHERGADGAPLHVIHRDVTPSNVLVGYDGHTKLVDFGVAKALATEGLTKSSRIKGKSGYLAPEQIRTQPLDHRCDLFALGVVLWEMTVGERLFRRDNELQTMNAILHEPPTRPTKRFAGYPRDLEEIVMMAVARNRDDRHADARALATDLRAVASVHGWDMESAALARLAETLVPAERLESEQTGPLRSISLPRPRSPTAPLSTALAADEPPASADPRETTADTSLRPELARAAAANVPVPSEQARPPASNRSAWITVILMLIASAVFWLLIVPAL